MRRILLILLPVLLLLAMQDAIAQKAGHDKNFILPLPINLNQADAEVLAMALDGIGEHKAQAIVRYRELNGPFKSVDDLTKVKGIGPGTLKRNKDRIKVD